MQRSASRSRTSLSRISLRRKRRQDRESILLKPIGFCCSLDNIDPLTKYDQRSPPFQSSLPPIEFVHENPVIKLQTEFLNAGDPDQKKKPNKFRPSKVGDRDLSDSKNIDRGFYSPRQPIEWYLEDEIAFAKDIFWEEKQKATNEETERNIGIAIEKRSTFSGGPKNIPRWYQAFSIDQLKSLMMLEHVISQDYEEMVTGRTQRILLKIGIMSTFFKVPPKDIRKLQESCNLNVINFLREIYKILTGDYFEDEGYKTTYDCNQRIILSAIAFLTLPGAVLELHKRLPIPAAPKLPKKPEPPARLPTEKTSSPYNQKLILPFDWASHRNHLNRWEESCKQIAIPKVILPNAGNVQESFEIKKDEKNFESKKDEKSFESKRDEKSSESKKDKKVESTYKPSVKENANIETNRHAIEDKTQEENAIINIVENEAEDIQEPILHDIPRLPDENKVFDFTISGLGEKPGPVEYKICGTMKTPRPNEKSWLGEKHAHYIISGASEDPPTCPILYEMTGVANVTPTNSNERFFAVLKLGDGPRKIYPSGRKYLSQKWQEWLGNADEEFTKVEREANKMIKNIEATTRLVFPGPICDGCCSCRQTKKSHAKMRQSKAPYFVIDSIAEDDKNNKYIVGSMAMHSPAPTPPDSTVNLLEVIASEDKITKNLIINGVTNEKGETQYYISGLNKETVHVPARTVEPSPPKPLKNVPPCVCAVRQIFAKGLDAKISKDDIPWTKNEDTCFGHKYRPKEAAAYSCKSHPADKSCRRNPFAKDVMKLKRKADRDKLKAEKDQSPESKKRMYSIADFEPCGDEHGMSLCGGPWGAKNLLSPEELKEQERTRKEILRAPPCGTKPGQAICGGEWGERIPKKSKFKLKDAKRADTEDDAEGGDEELDEDEEEEEEEKEERKEAAVEVKQKIRSRDKKCYMSPESIEDREKTTEKMGEKFIPDPNYHAYDDPWNKLRTAPSEKETEGEYEQSLKLTAAKPRTATMQVALKQKMTDTEKKKTGHIESKKVIRTKEEKGKNVHHTIRRTSKKGSPDTPKKKSQPQQISPKERSSTKKTTEQFVSPNTQFVSPNTQFVSPNTQPVSPNAQLVSPNVQSASPNAQSVSPNKQETQKNSTFLTKGKIPAHDASRKKKPEPSVNTKISKPQKTVLAGSEKLLENQSSVKKHENSKPVQKDVDVNKQYGKSGSLGTDHKLKKSSEKKIMKAHKRSKTKGVKHDEETDPAILRKKEVEKLKNMMMSSETYPYDVEPVDLPEEPPKQCGRGSEDEDVSRSSLSKLGESHLPLARKGPCGWKTKSEQELQAKKNLVDLIEPDYPMETIPVRAGGRPCTCRENRSKKKILLYNIGGLLDKQNNDTKVRQLRRIKKNGGEQKMQIIDGVTYYTPIPSPRESDEYVPEYDFSESPYDMCTSQCRDRNLELFAQHSGPQSLMSKLLKNIEPCGCNVYTDTFGIVDPKEDEEKKKQRQELIESKPPLERWSIALKDLGLVDYFTRCRDGMPCWTKCGKFDRGNCCSKYRQLKMKKPVCECKYERKILERNEEKKKWKERQQKLKSFKKQPIVNIADTSRPIEPDTKLMISDVKRIPREDEYIDDIKYCVTGVVENYSMAPPTQIITGLSMSTPLQTPKPSKHEIPCGCLHRHWSPTNIPPGPLPRKDEALMAEKERRKKALDEAFHQIYGPQDTIEDPHKHSCKGTCQPPNASVQEETEIMSQPGKESKDVADKMKVPKEPSVLKTKLKHSKNKQNKHVKDEVRKDKSQDHKKSEHETRVKTANEKTQKHFENDNGDLIRIVKMELKNMAEEGFVFAKLPKCFLMPQLRDWLLYRKGFALTEAVKKDLMLFTVMLWGMPRITKVETIDVPPLNMSKQQLRNLTFDDADRMKRKIQEKKRIFNSEVARVRVAFAQSLWNTMEYGKFPSISFMQAYFTYVASKEADALI